MKKVYLLIITIMILTTITLIINQPKGISGFMIEEELIDEDIIKKLILTKGNEKIKFSIIEGLDEISAKEMIKTNIYIFKAIYDREVSPYPGRLSNEISCGEDFIPLKKEIKKDDYKITYYETFLSERETYGVCTEDLIKYQGIISWTYCEKEEEYRKMEYIVNLNETIDNTIVFQNICKKIN